jgi:hypothetical protein
MMIVDPLSWEDRMRRIAPLLLIAIGGCGPRSAAEPSAPVALPPSGSSVGTASPQASVCLMQDGEPRTVPVAVRPSGSGMTTLDGQPLAAVSPPSQYAAGADWYQGNERIIFMERYYVRYGRVRRYAAADLARVGEYRGVSVFAAASAKTPGMYQMLYIPHGIGCEFQAYEGVHSNRDDVVPLPR